MFNYKIVRKIRDLNFLGNAAVQFEGQAFYTDKKGNLIYSKVANVTVSLAEYKLIEYFQTHPYSEELVRLIDEYGMEKYSDGIDNERFSNEDY